jgi:DNA-binding response OmpR family regulator
MKKSESPRRPRRGARTGSRKVSAGTLLLVDDDGVARRRISKALESKGYKVLTAGDGEEALALSVSFRGRIHLLITDVMMPVMNGKELSERLCAMRAEIHVLFVSAFSREDVLSGNGCSDREFWLAKPFTAAGLLARIRSILGDGPRGRGHRGRKPAPGA